MSKLIKFSLVAVLSLGLMPNTSFAQENEDDVEEWVSNVKSIEENNGWWIKRSNFKSKR